MALRAVANDPTLAQSVGVDVNRAILVSFFIGSALAGIGGIFWAYNTALSPLMGFTALLLGVVAAIVGGIGSLPGAFIGAILVAIAQHFAMWQFPSEWQDAIVFVILTLFLILRPQGFLGKPLRRATV
jgi:branched-chain amino acid transport system permease protein